MYYTLRVYIYITATSARLGEPVLFFSFLFHIWYHSTYVFLYIIFFSMWIFAILLPTIPKTRFFFKFAEEGAHPSESVLPFSFSLSLSLSVQCRVTSQLVWYPLLSLPFCCLPGLLRRLDCWKMFSHVHIHGYPRHLISRVSISSSTTLQLLLCNIHLYIHFDNVVHICQNLLLACPYFSFISFTLCTLCRS